MLSAPTCSSVDTSSTWSNDSSGNGSSRTSASTVSIPSTSRVGEIDADELDARAQQPAEVRRLGERVSDLEHAPSGTKAREHPRDLDHALVGCRPAPGASGSARGARSRAEPESDRVVELAHALDSSLVGELVDQRRARERPVRELRERTLAGLVVRRPPQDEPEHRVHELVVGPLVRGELGGDAGVHHAYS